MNPYTFRHMHLKHACLPFHHLSSKGQVELRFPACLATKIFLPVRQTATRRLTVPASSVPCIKPSAWAAQPHTQHQTSDADENCTSADTPGCGLRPLLHLRQRPTALHPGPVRRLWWLWRRQGQKEGEKRGSQPLQLLRQGLRRQGKENRRGHQGRLSPLLPLFKNKRRTSAVRLFPLLRASSTGRASPARASGSPAGR